MLPFYLCAARISAELPQTTSTRNVEAADINLLNVPVRENNIKTDGSVCANCPASLLYKICFWQLSKNFQGHSCVVIFLSVVMSVFVGK